MGDLSANFSREEFQCPHCKECQIEQPLIDGLQQLRDMVNRPIQILSGYRCAVHNRVINGEPLSLHLSGKAADIKIEGFDLLAMYQTAKMIPVFDKGGIGIYDDKPGIGEEFIHVDTRKQYGRWARMRGQYMSLNRGMEIYKKSTGR